MAQYLIKMKPLEPYFFGSDRDFLFGSGNKQQVVSYLIHSEKVPTQTTILGMLRYLGIKEKRKDFKIREEDNIGKASFCIEAEAEQDFGKIKKISPLFLLNEKEEILIKTPLDHRKKQKIYKRFPKYNNMHIPFVEYKKIQAYFPKYREIYTPFFEYDEVLTSTGQKRLPRNYDAKIGISDSYVNISTKKIDKNLFTKVTRIGINLDREEDGYFKKEFIQLDKKHVFAVLAELEGEWQSQTVFLGKRSVFHVEFIPLKKNYDKFNVYGLGKKILKKDFPKNCFALSDLYLKQEDIEKIYTMCDFVNVSTRDFRTFKTNQGIRNQQGRFHKGNGFKLIAAGSMFRAKDTDSLEKIKEIIKSYTNCTKIGFNKMIYGGKKDGSKCV